MSDQHHLSSRYRARSLRAQHEAAVARAICEAGERAPVTPSHVLPGDHRRLRGIPVSGVRGGMGGAVPGSRPDRIRWPEG